MTIAEQLIEEGRQEGRQQGLQQGREEGRQENRIATLRRQLLCKFKLQTLDPAYEVQLQAATPETLDYYLERVLTADSLAAVFAD